jgi:hypothetical protein
VRTDPQGDAGKISELVPLAQVGAKNVTPKVKFFSPKAVSKGTQHPATSKWVTPVMAPNFATVVSPCQ